MKKLFSLLLLLLPLTALAGAYEDMEEAMIRKDSASVIALLDRGMDVNTVSRTGDTLLIQVIHGHQHAVGIVLAVVGLAARHGCHGGQLDDLGISRRRCCSIASAGGRRCRGFGFLATGCQHGTGCEDGGYAQTEFKLHGALPLHKDGSRRHPRNADCHDLAVEKKL